MNRKVNPKVLFNTSKSAMGKIYFKDHFSILWIAYGFILMENHGYKVYKKMWFFLAKNTPALGNSNLSLY